MKVGQKRGELILYAVVWAVLFAAPILSVYIDFVTSSDAHAACDWHGAFSAWRLLLMFFATFCIHNFLVAPLLVYRDRRRVYSLLVVILFALFAYFQCAVQPHRPQPGEKLAKPNMEQRIERPLPPREPRGEKMPPRKPMVPRGEAHPDAHEHNEPPLVFGGQDQVAFIIMLLLLALNVGAKYYFKSLDDRKRMKELERENLHRQLEYLKYQINPHFFMNTLNNIHALVDIDPEQAKYTIEVLSKLMRYVLYEGNKAMAPLQKELLFLSHYVDLMRIRYTDKVRISLSLPTAPSDVEVPSLLFITFVENAFKHGVSYAADSFIEVRVDVDANAIRFSCRNSCKPTAEDTHGGVGLDNARKRLRLIYGSSYELRTTCLNQVYHVELKLPIQFSL